MEDALAAALATADDEVEVDQDGSDYVDEGIETSIDLTAGEWLPAATFDVMVLVDELGRHGDPGRLEIHTFAYLGCLMSVFRGEPASDWNYSFTAVPPTLPYSPTLETASSALLVSGKIVQEGGVSDEESLSFRLTATGRSDLQLLASLGSFAPRLPYLQAAAKTAVFTSLHAVVNSLSFEPQLARAVSLDRPRVLLTQVGAASLYEEFDALTQVLGPEHRELLVPASLYVSFLQARSQELGQGGPAEEDNDDSAE